MENEPLNIIILGRSGSGKGTQAKLLVDAFHLEYIGTGNLLRTFSERDNVAAKCVKRMLGAGELVPSWLPFFVWMEKLAYSDEQKGMLFDGSPRKLEEAKILDEVLAWFGRAKVKVILIDVSREEVYQRLMKRRICSQCGRGADFEDEHINAKQCHYCYGSLTVRMEDNPEGIKTRLDWFDEHVVPVIEHYKKKGNLIEINGLQDPETTHKEILAKLGVEHYHGHS